MMSLPFLLPIHRFPIASFHSEALAVFLGLLGMLVFLSLHEKLTQSLTSSMILPVGMALIVLLQWMLGRFTYGANALIYLAILIWVSGLLWVFANLFEIYGREIVLLQTSYWIFLGGLLNALAGIAQLFNPESLGTAWVIAAMPHSGVYGNLAQQNHFAAHCALALTALCYLWRIKRNSLFVLPAPVLVMALFFSGSRSAFLYLAFILWAVLGHQMSDKVGSILSRIKWRKTLLVILIVSLSFYFVSYWAQQHFPAYAHHVDRYLNFSEALGSRYYLWHAAWEMFLKAPLLGVGFEHFAFELFEQMPLTATATHWGLDQYAHNLFFQILAVAGLAGIAVLLSFVVVFVWAQRRVQTSLSRRFLWVMFAIMAFHSLLEQPLYYAYFLAFFAFVLAGLDRSWKIIGLQFFSRFARVAMLGGVFLLIAITGKSVLDYQKLSDIFYETTVTSTGAMSEQEQTRSIQALHTFSLWTAMVEALAPQKFVPHDSDVRDKLDLNARLLQTSPVAETAFRQAALWAEYGNELQAHLQFQKAALAYPMQAAMYAQRYEILAASEPDNYLGLAHFAREELSRLQLK